MKQRLQFAFHVAVHPFDGFWDMKREKKGRLWVAFLFVFLVVVTQICNKQVTSFLFNPQKDANPDVVSEFIKIILLYVVFCIANWSITTLMDGEGTMKDILMATGYACLPVICIQVPVAVLSNIASFSESVYLSAAIVVSWIWFGVLLFIGIMTIHQYSVGRMVFTTILTACAMAVILFGYMLFVNLFTQLVGFALSIYKEIVFRM